jgi:hypothetical protein
VELEADLRANIDNGIKGTTLARAIRQFKSDRFQAGRAIYSGSVDKILSAGEKLTVEQALREAYLSASPVENPETLELDFKPQKEARADVLRQAVELGIDPAVITDKGKRADDPKVDEVLKEYEAAMEKLEPYFNVEEQILEQRPAWKRLMDQYARTGPSGKTPDPYIHKVIQDSQEYKFFKLSVKTKQEAMRHANSVQATMLEKAGRTWLGWTPLKGQRRFSFDAPLPATATPVPARPAATPQPTATPRPPYVPPPGRPGVRPAATAAPVLSGAR